VTCFHPMIAWRAKTGQRPAGGWPIVFKIENGLPETELKIPCGKCIGCRLDKTAHWAMRIMCEAEMHEKNCYLTLTYREDEISENKSLEKKEITLFWKRLRYELYKGEQGRAIRYFSAGEYGDKKGRPHYHAALFGCDFSEDKLAWKQGAKDILFVSPTLDKAWGKGIATIQELNLDSALYIAKYVVKRLQGPYAVQYGGKEPEFALMSRNPGLANEWLMKYMDDVKAIDGVMIKPGKIARPGRYFDSIMGDMDKNYIDNVKLERKKKIDPEQDTFRRLKAREKLKLHQMKWKKHRYEKQSLFN